MLVNDRKSYVRKTVDFVLGDLLLSFIAFVVVSGTNFVQIRNQLVKCFAIDDQTTDAVFVVCDYISCSQIIAINPN